jgi:hypothetical protein
MKKATWIAACLLVACTGQAFADRDPSYFGKNEPAKIKDSKPSSEPAVPIISAGGETFATATPIPALPYNDGGNTCNAINDYTPTCAFSPGAPDLVYVFRPTTDVCINIETCGSGYDTMLHVHDGGGAEIACNDDFCGLSSTIEGLQLAGGGTYYIVVDGFNVACGSYVFSVTECPPPCDYACPPGSFPEGEPVCHDEYVDATNGGCNSTPVVLTELPCDDDGLTVCGTYGTYLFEGGNFRDTDWYEVTVTSATVLTACVCGSSGTQLALLNGTCEPITLICGSVFGSPGEEICCSVNVTPGTYWIFVGTDTFAGVACGSPYKLTVTGNVCPPVGVEPADWSNVKNLYR